MQSFHFPFSFAEDDSSTIKGSLELDEPVNYLTQDEQEAVFRPARIVLNECDNLDIVLYHNRFTESFMYLRQMQIDRNLAGLLGLKDSTYSSERPVFLPGQLCLGADRVELIGQAMRDLTASPILHATIAGYQQHNLAIFPIAREGLKYQVAEAIHHNYGYYCDEVVLDAHHVFDSSVPIYNRKVEMTLFKDKDLDKTQKDNINVAFIADSIASGLVLKEVIAKVKERFDNIHQIEVLAPLATIRGLCRIARARCEQDVQVRVHVFETLLNALPPDFYYSAHYDIPQMHICPDLEANYRAWWGQDRAGNMIADTACAGYGWSEVFFSPRKQLEMINGELQRRHQMALSDVLARRLG